LAFYFHIFPFTIEIEICTESHDISLPEATNFFLHSYQKPQLIEYKQTANWVVTTK